MIMRESQDVISAKDARERIKNFMAVIARLMRILVRGP
jgi:hypothetical protein